VTSDITGQFFRILIAFYFLDDIETFEVRHQARPGAQGSFGEATPITADQLASAIASAQPPGRFFFTLTKL
jgi:hypothetical protein